MIPLDWILGGVVIEGMMFLQVPGAGWMAAPEGMLPYNRNDPWVCYQAAAAYNEHLKEERGY